MRPYPQRIGLSVPHISGRELEYVQEVFASNWLTTVGPPVERLEQEFGGYLGVPAVALASGTAGIHLGLKLLGIRPGDEVVCPTLTFVATANPVLYEQGRPVFIDSDYSSWNLDPELLREFLRRRAERGNLPRAIMVVHLFGLCGEMERLMEVAGEYDLPVIEDAAEALGSRYRGRLAGTMGDVGVFSLNGNKIITGAGGGMLASRHSGWVEKVSFWSKQSCEPGLQYSHSEVGYNYRMSTLSAAVARGQLEVLEERVQTRRRIAGRYRAELEEIRGLSFMPFLEGTEPSCWLSCILIDEERYGRSAGELVAELRRMNVEARPVWKPMHCQKLFQHAECVGGGVAEDLNQRGICLPSSSRMSEEEQEYVIRVIREFQVN